MNKHQLLKIWFISIFLLMSGFSQATENYIEEKGCKDLGKVTDIDNLLYQFYSNIDSQCLFEIPTQELQNIWAVRIYDYTDLTLDERTTLQKDFKEAFSIPYRLIVIKTEHEGVIKFYVITSTRFDQSAWGGKVGKGEFPSLLPKPNIQSVEFELISERYIHGYTPDNRAKPLSNSVYKKYSTYYWLNKELSGSKPSLYGYTSSDSNVIMGFYFISKTNVLDFLKKGIDYDVK